MPAAVVKNKAGEAAWTRAKAQVSKEYPDVSKDSDRYYQLVMHIYKSICTSPKHDCGPTLRTHPSSRSRRESMSTSELLNKIEEGAESQGDELTEMISGLDPDQERLYHDLMMSASNEGRFYEKADAKGAVEASAKEIMRIRAENLRHDIKVVKPLVTKKLAQRWKKTR